MRESDDILITGFGIVSNLGDTAAQVAAAFEANPAVCRAGEMANIPLDDVPQDKRARLGRLDRLCRMTLVAAFRAVADAELAIAPASADRVGLSIGTGLGCLLTNAEYYEKIVAAGGPSAASPRLFAYTVSSAAAGEVSIALGITGPNLTAHMGFAAGLGAIGYGADLIRLGKADVVIAGGADALGAAVVDGLRDMNLLKVPAAARPFTDEVPGIVPSEAAVLVVLERRAHAEARGASIKARVRGYAAGFEPTLTLRKPQSTALVRTVGGALARGEANDGPLTVWTSAHGTPTDRVERQALVEALSGRQQTVLLAPKVVSGECFAASAPLALAAATEWLARPAAPASGLAFDVGGTPLAPAHGASLLASGQVALVHSVCYSGATVALLLSRNR